MQEREPLCRRRGCIEGDIYGVREWEDLDRGEKGTERRECLELTEQTCLQEDLEQKRERTGQGIALETIPEET